MRYAKETVDQFFQHGIHLPTRTLYIGDGEDSEITPQTSAQFVKGLHLLQAASGEAVRVMLQTVGGCTVSCMAIYDAIAKCTCHVTVEAYGGSMSAGAVLMQAADDRAMHAHATFMLHDGSMTYGGHARDYEGWAAWSKQQRRVMYEIFAVRTGKKPGYWASKSERDYILTPPEALAERLIDRII